MRDCYDDFSTLSSSGYDFTNSAQKGLMNGDFSVNERFGEKALE